MDIAQLVKEGKQGSASVQKCLFDLLANRMMLKTSYEPSLWFNNFLEE